MNHQYLSSRLLLYLERQAILCVDNNCHEALSHNSCFPFAKSFAF